MKFLCRHEQFASFFIYRGLAAALSDMGNQFAMWNTEQYSAFDIFDLIKPDVFIGQGYNLDRATIKCLNENPQIKVILKVGAGSKEFRSEYEQEKYQVLMATEKEHELVNQIQDKGRVLLFNYCHPNRANYVIGEWAEAGYKIWGFLPACDTKNFFPEKYDERYKSDIVFCGGYWSYKSINLDRYIIPLCLPLGKYNIKVFGNQIWPIPMYLGVLSDENLRKFFSSSTICPNIHEPHSNRYGFDIVARLFNIIGCKGFCISDYVESIEKDVFTNNEIILVETPEEFFEKINYFIKNPIERISYIEKGYTEVMKNHTYYHRAIDLLEQLK
jgi:hypothetical protein